MGEHGGTTYVRRDIWKLAPEDPIVTAYAKAVKRLRERGEEDPTSWSYQAAIHGSETTPSQPLWNQCQHGGWFFLPWHRMYLYFFERIVRAAVLETDGPENWALPYWNYGPGGRPKLPEAFRNPKLPNGEENPLYTADRAPGINSGAELPPQVVNPSAALARPDFIGTAEFGGGITAAGQFWHLTGRLEQTPHNDVHNEVGGLMGEIVTAALDPIFWLHHANIDRLWATWAALPGRADPSQQEWRDHGFALFDEHRQQASLKCGDVVETMDLGYVYEPPGEPTPTPPRPTRPIVARAAAPVPPRPPAERAMTTVEPQLVGASEKPLVLVGAPASVPVHIDGAAVKHASEVAGHVYLNVEDIQGETNPGTVYGIYLDMPEEASADLEAAHHIGNVSFFGIERARNPRGDEHAHGLRVSMSITRFARELEARGEWADHDLVVSFRPLSLTPPEVPDENDLVKPPSGEDPPVRIGRVSVFYDA